MGRGKSRDYGSHGPLSILGFPVLRLEWAQNTRHYRITPRLRQRRCFEVARIPFPQMNRGQDDVHWYVWSTGMAACAEESPRDPVRASARLRAWNIFFRTAHIGVIAVLFGGHAFDVASGRLLPWLYAAILTGAVLAVIEAYPDWRWCGQASGLMTIVKVALLLLIPWLRDYCVPILGAVIVLGSVGSHMPRRYRHYLLLFRRVPSHTGKTAGKGA